MKENWFKRKWHAFYPKFKHAFTETKFGQVWLKYRLQYLAYVALMEGFMASLYFITSYLPVPCTVFNLDLVDNKVPFVSYFYFFYLLYYVVPELGVWVLAFFDKKKSFNIISCCFIATVLCCFCYCIYQVKMIRPMDEVTPYKDFSNVYNVDTFFRWALNIQYQADPTAKNCMPSLHATVGTGLFVVGMYMGKGEKHFPIGWRVFFGIFGLGIVLSTFFIKQHYFFDALVGFIVFIATYYVFTLWFMPFISSRREKEKERTLAINEISCGNKAIDKDVINLEIDEYQSTKKKLLVSGSILTGVGFIFLLTCAILTSALHIDAFIDVVAYVLLMSSIIIGAVAMLIGIIFIIYQATSIKNKIVIREQLITK